MKNLSSFLQSPSTIKKILIKPMNMMKLFLAWILLMGFGQVYGQTYCFTAPQGYGAGTTGGGNATPTTVSTYSALKTALTSSSAAVILVSGTIDFSSSGMIKATITNKTLIGLPGAKLVNTNQSTSGILYLSTGSSNVIIRNLIFVGPGAWDNNGNDNLTVKSCSKLWVDHCEFQDGEDGNFDNSAVTDNVTVTWCKFTYLKSPRPHGSGTTDDHRFTNLVGGSDSDKPSDGQYSITWQYCWWAQGCVERMTRARNAQLNMVSCYWNSSVTKVALGLGGVTDCYVENSVFDNPGDKYRYYDNGTVRLTTTGCTAPPANVGTCPVPSYTRESIAAGSVVSALTGPCGAGATLNVTSAGVISAKSTCSGTPVNQAPTVSITSPANNATFTAPATVTMNATAADADGTVTKVDFYNGTTLLGTDASSPYTYAWTNVAAGTYTITAKATDNSGAVSTSTAITVVVNPAGQAPTVSITSPVNAATFTAPASVTITANAADADGTITKVDFYNGATLLGTDATSPYSYAWTNVAAGTYSITAKATDNSGAVTTSSPISITVNGVPGSDVTIQAETACAIVGVLETKNAGFNGASYVNVDNAVGTTITWSVNSTGSQTVNLTLRYAGTTDRNMSLSVNGTMQVPVVAFPLTGAFTTWNTSVVSITLSAGTNKITASSLTTDGGPNIDELTFNSSTITAGSCSQTPIVSITSPSNNANFIAPANVTITANAADADGTVSQVDFYNGTTLLGTDASSPYSFAFNNLSAGTYSLTAKATDNTGAITTSAVINITVGVGTGIISTSYGAFTQVYPNPSHGAFTVKASQGIKNLSVINMYGVEVISFEEISADQQLEIGNELTDGTYVLIIKYTSDKMEVAKIVKIK